MLRWTRNIFIAAAVAMLLCTILFDMVAGDFLQQLAIAAGILIALICVGVTGTSVLWTLGLTRFSASRIRQRSVIILTYIEQAVRLNLPLTRMLIAAEASEPRWIGGRIRRVRQRLDDGNNISDTIRKALPGVSRRDLALIVAAERVGRVGPELTRVVRHEQTIMGRNIAERSFLRSYPVAMTAVIVGILSMVMVFVIPKFQQIFKDFRTPLPPLTQAVIRLTSPPYDLDWFTLSIAIAVMLAIVQQLRQRLDWRGPARWLTADRDLADICHVVAESMEAGLPQAAAIRSATDLSIGGSMRRRLNLWADGIERGQPTIDAAQSAGMPKLIAGLTTSAEGFEFLSRYYAGKFSRLMTLFRAAAIPAMVFFFGIIVAIVALSLFLPLVALIDAVGPYGSWR